MNKNSKGFTLIELLVVIAIIGILAALVLVALGNAREKANDARIKSSIGQLRVIAEILYDTHGAAYQNAGNTAGVEVCVEGPTATTCGADNSASVATLIADINSANGAVGGAPTSESTASDFCIEAQLNDTTFVCVDNTGVTQTNPTTACSTDGDVSCAL